MGLVDGLHPPWRLQLKPPLQQVGPHSLGVQALGGTPTEARTYTCGRVDVLTDGETLCAQTAVHKDETMRTEGQFPPPSPQTQAYSVHVGRIALSS